jgi:hypothetical protein
MGNYGRNIDLVDSPDDNGFYFREYNNGEDRWSTTYATRDDANEAYDKGRIKWETTTPRFDRFKGGSNDRVL